LCLISEDTELIPVLLGQISSGIPDHEFLMVCPLCEGEDYECFGERYFHRLHQAAGVFVCPKHRTFLVKTVVSRKDLRSFISAESVFEDIPPTFIDEANEEHLRLLFIAEEMNTLLNLGKVSHH
jgi:hypothetical protein